MNLAKSVLVIWSVVSDGFIIVLDNTAGIQLIVTIIASIISVGFLVVVCICCYGRADDNNSDVGEDDIETVEKSGSPQEFSIWSPFLSKSIRYKSCLLDILGLPY